MSLIPVGIATVAVIIIIDCIDIYALFEQRQLRSFATTLHTTFFCANIKSTLRLIR